MGFIDRLFGTEKNDPGTRPRYERAPTADEQALQRYRYMVQNAPPETIEQAHTEAFERLTPEQRRLVLAELVQATPSHEQAAAERTSSEDPRAMARLATRNEIRQPGIMERSLGGGLGLGSSLLASFAAGFLGSMVAQSFFSGLGGFEGDHGAADEPSAHADESTGADEDADIDDGGDDVDFDMDV
jgi:hypothetical protein